VQLAHIMEPQARLQQPLVQHAPQVTIALQLHQQLQQHVPLEHLWVLLVQPLVLNALKGSMSQPQQVLLAQHVVLDTIAQVLV
jgi:hypothetical protein